MRTQRRFQPTGDGLESRDVPAAVGITSRIAHFSHNALAGRLNTPFANSAHLGTASFGRQLGATRAAAANSNLLANNSALSQLTSRLNSGQLSPAAELNTLINAFRQGLINRNQFNTLVNANQLANSSLVGSVGNTITNGLLSTTTNRNFPATLSGGGSTSGSLFNNGMFGNTSLLGTGPFSGTGSFGTPTSLTAGSLGFFPF